MNRAKILQIEQLRNTIKEREGEMLIMYTLYCVNGIFFTVFEKELLSVSNKRQREIETLQEIITSLTLKVRERDKQIEELKQSLKGN